eukprot:3228542-Pyramimonas_sp.AAC.2
MTQTDEVDLHSDSGYRRQGGDADGDVEGYDIRGASLLRRGSTPAGAPVVHIIDAHCKSHRLQACSRYSADALAAADNLEDCYPAIVTLHALHAGPLTPTQLKDMHDMGCLSTKVILTMHAESVSKSLSKTNRNRPSVHFWGASVGCDR